MKPTTIHDRERLASLHDELAQRYWQNEPVETLIADLTRGMDEIIVDLYNAVFDPEKNSAGIALYAVGGYGRGELHPGSDIDLLIVARKPEKHRSDIETFFQAVFDLNIEVGHSVRDLKACKTEARNDITVATAMFERRFLCGDPGVTKAVDRVMDNPRLWPAEKFFRAKLDEQIQRHKQHDNTEYNLEPNIKSSPGGLRDIHTAMWICKRQFGTADLDVLVERGVFTEEEQRWLLQGRRFIWWVRFGLHLIAGRKEDRLQFAHQRELADRLGFVDTDAQRGVERFMHHYYRHVLALTEVNDILIQYFSEAVVKQRASKPVAINERFNLVNNYIEAAAPDTFRAHPSALLELFVIMANRNDIAGVRAKTIRQVRDSLDLIDDDFRNNPTHTDLFMSVLKAPYTLVSQLTRMRRYGILGRYIPEYGQVIGQMQHDLFHIYTVDAHTMMVIRNMRRFRYRASEEAYPVAYHCVHSIPKLELLYVAGLYHDIGKGRGGDHSELGARDARQFCERHQLNEADTELVCWLVEQHLYMSTVSQREDIYDPDVVQRFARVVKSAMRLDYLYALTVADVTATNPTLWNSWRATLLRQLYTETRRVLRLGVESANDKRTTIAAYQERALERLGAHETPDFAARIRALWADFGEDFFLRHSPPRIAALTETLLDYDLETGPYVELQDIRGDFVGEGATRLYIYAEDQPDLFAKTVISLSEFDLTVVAASVNTGPTSRCFDTYTLLTHDGTPLPRDPRLRERITHRVIEAICSGSELQPNAGRRRLPRQLQELPWPTHVSITPVGAQNPPGTTVTIVASDRPGLLATIALIFVDVGLKLVSAKIATLGERVEDTFVVLNRDDQPIGSGEETYTLQHTIRQRLDQAMGVNQRPRHSA